MEYRAELTELAREDMLSVVLVLFISSRLGDCTAPISLVLFIRSVSLAFTLMLLFTLLCSAPRLSLDVMSKGTGSSISIGVLLSASVGMVPSANAIPENTVVISTIDKHKDMTDLNFNFIFLYLSFYFMFFSHFCQYYNKLFNTSESPRFWYLLMRFAAFSGFRVFSSP